MREPSPSSKLHAAALLDADRVVIASSLAPMRLRRTFRLALKNLWLHRLRSLLTVLGIVFGVCSVIAMLAIGEGASFEAQEQIKNLGSQNIILRSVKPPEEQKVSEKGSQSYVLQYGITYTDFETHSKSTIPGVTVLVPGRIMRDYVWNISRRVDCDIVRHRSVVSGDAKPSRRPRPLFHRGGHGRQRQRLRARRRDGAGPVPAGFPIGPGRPRWRQLLPRHRRDGTAQQDAPKDSTTTRDGARAPRYQMFIPLETAKTRYGEVLIETAERQL